METEIAHESRAYKLESEEGASNGAPSSADRSLMRLEAAYHRLGAVGNELEHRLTAVLTPGWGQTIGETYPTEAIAVDREPSPLVAEIERYASRFEMEIDRLARILAGLDT